MPMDWCEKKPLSDSTWYMYFGHAMKKSQLMYVDIFDHKGPLLFFINYIGMLISENFGVWIMCTAAIFMFYIFSYKTARLVTSKVFSLLVISLSAVCICGCLQGGNYADLYSMPFIMYSVYVYLSFFINEESVKKYQILLVRDLRSMFVYASCKLNSSVVMFFIFYTFILAS